MSAVVIKGGRIIDETGERQADVAIAEGRVAEVGPNLDTTGATVLDATDCVVSPGFVDLHTHLREPGREEAETVETGARAAALGGYTAVLAMPNTEPAIDSAAVVRQVIDAGAKALCAVHVAGSITVGRAGKQLSPMAEMAELGVRLFTDDGCGVQDDRLMRRALEYAGGLGLTLAQHCEVEALSEGGHMHEGEWSSRLGIPGVPAEAEELMVFRDIALSRLTGTRVHIQHLSTAGSVELVRAAKAKGLPVTAEATPHHLALTHAEVAGYDPVFKVNPPLRTSEDVAAVRAGLADGTIDAIATDHAPHTQEVKEQPFDQAPCGMLGLETALGVALTSLAGPRDADEGPDAIPADRACMELAAIVGALTWRPAAIARLHPAQGGPVAAGRPANLCVFDPKERWTVEPARSASRSRNTPFAGRRLTGRVRHTILRGEAVVIAGEAQR
jgi:dihydroorotase